MMSQTFVVLHISIVSTGIHGSKISEFNSFCTKHYWRFRFRTVFRILRLFLSDFGSFVFYQANIQKNSMKPGIQPCVTHMNHTVGVHLSLVGGLIHKYECDKSTHHFHDLSAPMREQLQTLQSQIKQLPVFRVCLLGLLTPWASHYLQKWEKKAMTEQENKIT